MGINVSIADLVNMVRSLENNPAEMNKQSMPGKCFFLDQEKVLCYPRADGDSRYPYCYDGFTLWAYSSGYISVNESTFYVILPADEGKEPYLSFFAGIKSVDGSFFPVSLLGVARQPREKDIKRYCIYSPQAVYYITETPEIVFAVRAFVTEKKQTCFSVYAINLADHKTEIYLSSYFNCLLKHEAGESVETKWFKQCGFHGSCFEFVSTEDLSREIHLRHYGIIQRQVKADDVIGISNTTSKSVYTGGKTNSLNCSTSLFDGAFSRSKDFTQFTDTSVAGDIITLGLAPKAQARVDYRLQIGADAKEETRILDETISASEFDDWIKQKESEYRMKHDDARMLRLSFGKWNDGKVNSLVLNRFLSSVINQVEFCALAKNSGVSLLGIRDVFQQIEAALVWNPKACREKIIEAISFIDSSGRPPRQYSIPAPGASPQMDLRPFIDQGVWIISTIYTYLAYTKDFSILDQACGYYDIIGHNQVRLSDTRDSVLSHMLRVMDYLLKNVDVDSTDCLRALYGDWNDALDGLGTSLDKSREYGSGVSVMATLQLYQNLGEMTEILSDVGKYQDKADSYISYKEKIKRGLQKYAIEKNEQGETRILHGWGDKRSYKVGSFRDPDGQSRDGLAANAFWVLSGAYKWDKGIKDTILSAYGRLDSKYGLKTFEPFFPSDMKGVGRIVNLPSGTAENAASYVHATLFGASSLFGLGESERAWEQIEKVLPITHSLITTTPFVMSNSYSYNPEKDMDGESMSDWFTGSSGVLIKTLVRFGFGIYPRLDEVIIQPAIRMPSDEADISMMIRGCHLTLSYRNRHVGTRQFILNGKTRPSHFDQYMNLPTIILSDSDFSDKEISIEVID